MVVEKIKGLMEELNLNQLLIAEELTSITNKYYSQSMISKRLKDDNCISVDELLHIWRILNRYYKLRSGSDSDLKLDYFVTYNT